MRIRIPHFMAGLAVHTLLATSAVAGSWEIEPLFSASGRFNDNPALAAETQNPESTFSTIGTAEFAMSKREPNSTVAITPQIKQTYYPDKKFRDLNSTDYFLRASYSYFQPLLSLSATVNYDNQSVLSSEDADPDNPDDSGSGNFLRVDDTRQRISISPSINWTPTQKDSYVLGLSLARTDHELDFTNRADVDSGAVNFSYQRLVTQRHSLGFIATAYTSKSDRQAIIPVCGDGSIPVTCLPVGVTVGEITNDADGESFSLSYGYQWSELTKINMSYGLQSSSVTSGANVPLDSFESSASFDSAQYQLGLENTGERYEWELNASRSVQPSSNGSPSDKTQLQGSILYRFTPQLAGKFAAIGYDQSSRNAFSVRKNRFLRADATLSWTLNRNWSLAGVYTFRNRDPELVNISEAVTDETANLERKSNSFTLSTRYRFR